ncbi:MAG: ABC transporter permease [Bacteroidetes bacterium]|nr:ABC transporter permease [Bacteroidota bacterium]
MKIIIEPNKKATHYWSELKSFKELFYFLAWKDILVRYKQTTIGLLWAFIRPFLSIVVFTIIGNLGSFPNEGVPYALLVAVGILPWQFFSSAFSEASNSMVSNSGMISKVYFPRIIIPVSSVIVCIIDFIVALVMTVVLMLWFNYLPSYRIIFMPFFFALLLILALGIGFWIASLNVKYRDFRYIVPFIIQFGVFISPVMYISNTFTNPAIRMIYSLNPLVGIIDGFRWSMLGGNISIYWPAVVYSAVVSIFFLVFGFSFFRKTERFFADIV